MAMNAREIEAMIKAALPDAKVTIRDLAGDGDHYAAEVVSASFRGNDDAGVRISPMRAG